MSQAKIECRATAAWSGWTETGSRRVALGSSAAGKCRVDPWERTLDVESFPGRWDPRRSLPHQLEPLPLVATAALERAGWLPAPSGQVCEGGLVLGCDGGPLAEVIGFARRVREQTTVAPSGFLYSLPSTGASVLGLLFGLGDYQSTVVQGPLSGVQALRHAIDLMALSRLDRVLVAALSVIEGAPGEALDGNGLRLAVALCLERSGTNSSSKTPTVALGSEGPGPGQKSEVGEEERELMERLQPLPQPCREVGALPLVRVAMRLETARHPSSPQSTWIHQRVPWLHDERWISIERKDN